jgi:hypothetical protein
MNIAQAVPAFKSVVDWIQNLNWIEQAAIATAVAITTLAAGWKPLLAFYRWCLEKYDNVILHQFTEGLRSAKLKHPNQHIDLLPLPLARISDTANRSEKNVYRSLRRLESAGKVEEVSDGWILKGQKIPIRPHVYRV